MSHRITWDQLPAAVRDRVERLLGAPVRSARTADGGFSPSSAAIVSSAQGRSLFVKAVAREISASSDGLNRREAGTLAALPATVPAPRRVDAFEVDGWFVLVLEAAPGRNPVLPWRADELDAVLVALDALQDGLTPSPLPEVRTYDEALGWNLRGFERLAADRAADLDPWFGTRLDALGASAERGIAALAGDTLCHGDLRADNLLVAADGRVAVVDWAWASRGSRFADALQLLSSVDDRGGGLDLDARIDAVMHRHGEARETATDVLAGILGFFVEASRGPVDPALPTLLDHRRARRDSLFAIVRRRWEAEGRE